MLHRRANVFPQHLCIAQKKQISMMSITME